MADWPYPRLVAHRGGGALAPENTLAALAMGARHGYRMVEFDAKLSGDGKVFLLHDDSVARTSNGAGLAAQLTYAEIAGLDAGSWFHARFSGESMPSLQPVLACCAALGLAANVEIKPCAGRERETGAGVAAETQRCWDALAAQATQQYLPPLLSSFSYPALESACETAPGLPRGLLVGTVPSDWRAQTERLECMSIHVDHRHLNQALIAEFRAAGLHVFAYTVNSLEVSHRLMQWGVAAVCTDRIDLLVP